MSVGHGSDLIGVKRWLEPFPSALRAQGAALRKTSYCDVFFTTTDNAKAPTTACIPRCRHLPWIVGPHVPHKQSP